MLLTRVTVVVVLHNEQMNDVLFSSVFVSRIFQVSFAQGWGGVATSKHRSHSVGGDYFRSSGVETVSNPALNIGKRSSWNVRMSGWIQGGREGGTGWTFLTTECFSMLTKNGQLPLCVASID